MEREHVITVTPTEESAEGKFSLEYLMIEEETVCESGFGICTYGLEVIKRSKNGIESQTVPSISSDRAVVMHFITLAARHSVTPTTILNVVYDLLYEKEISDFESERMYLYESEGMPDAAVG